MKLLYKVFTLFLFFSFTACKFAETVYKQPSSNLTLTPDVAPSEQIEGLIRPYKEGMSASMNETIGFCPTFIEKHKPSSAIGSMMADAVMSLAQKTEPKTAFTLLNYGGIRSSLDSGQITVGEVFQIMPFENEIVILELKASYLDTLRLFVQNKNGEPMSEEVNNLNYDKIISDGFFYLATNDYMANGGDNYSFLLNASKRIATGVKIREALMIYIKDNNPLPLDHGERTL